MTHKNIILASASKIRIQLLQSAGLKFDHTPARVDETAVRASLQAEGAKPRDVADTLAEFKARKIAQRAPDALIIGCDQVLALKTDVLEKAETLDQARNVLMRLRGMTHSLFSAAVVYEDGAPIWRHVGVVRLSMRQFSDQYLETYLDRNWPDVADAVGCYKLESEGVRLFSQVQGDYFDVLGLPLLPLLSYLTLRGDVDG
ncbi:MAG: Maf family nucleotide pyrophosphatase [Pseudomonadota bacterium]